MERWDCSGGFPVTQTKLNHLQKDYKLGIGYMMENWPKTLKSIKHQWCPLNFPLRYLMILIRLVLVRPPSTRHGSWWPNVHLEDANRIEKLLSITFILINMLTGLASWLLEIPDNCHVKTEVPGLAGRWLVSGVGMSGCPSFTCQSIII